MFTSALTCGAVLTFEQWSFLPDIGDRMPCRRHGYCTVASRDEPTPPPARRSAPRSQIDLLQWLQDRPSTTLSRLRTERFTLRLVHAAAQAGALDVDFESGQVRVRDDHPGHPAGRRPAQAS
jgi:hypothetical protein